MVTHKEIGENRGKGGPHGYTIHLIIEVTFEQEVSFLGSKLKQPFELIFTKFQPWITLSNIFDGKVSTIIQRDVGEEAFNIEGDHKHPMQI